MYYVISDFLSRLQNSMGKTCILHCSLQMAFSANSVHETVKWLELKAAKNKDFSISKKT